MFIVVLRFSKGKSRASELMAGHSEWIRTGMNDGVFLAVGSLQPGLGGIIVAHNTTRTVLEARLEHDPFIAQDVVRAELLDVSLSKADPRLAFLLV